MKKNTPLIVLMIILRKKFYSLRIEREILTCFYVQLTDVECARNFILKWRKRLFY